MHGPTSHRTSNRFGNAKCMQDNHMAKHETKRRIIRMTMSRLIIIVPCAPCAGRMQCKNRARTVRAQYRHSTGTVSAKYRGDTYMQCSYSATPSPLQYQCIAAALPVEHLYIRSSPLVDSTKEGHPRTVPTQYQHNAFSSHTKWARDGHTMRALRAQHHHSKSCDLRSPGCVWGMDCPSGLPFWVALPEG